jgi:hypothetical protein
MKQYIGSKIVNAVPEYRCHRPGYLFQYVSVGDIVPAGWDAEDGYRIEYEDGYRSWCPKEVFEAAYRETTGMSFGLAIEAVKKGLRIARAGWNGKDMYVFLSDGVEFSTMADMSEFANEEVYVSDLLVLRTAQKTLQPGWLATQSDILADDWYILE